MLKQLPRQDQVSLQEYWQTKIDNRNRQRNLLPFFWLLVGAYVAFCVYNIYTVKDLNLEDIFGSVSISCASLISVYLWCSGKAFGVPVFPLFSLTYLWTTAIPLIAGNPSVFTYSVSERLTASMTVSAFLLLATFIWFQFVNRFPISAKSYRVLDIDRGESIFLGVLFVGSLYGLLNLAGWLFLDTGVGSLIRGAVLGLMAIATFAMSYRFGSKKLSKGSSLLFLILIISNLITTSISLLLVGSLTLFLIAVVGYSLGKGKPPWITIIIMLSLFSLLHAGKAQIRELYWQQQVQPWQYPSIYAEWVNFGIQELMAPKEEEDASNQSIIERASVFQQLLLTQSMTEKGYPLLDGYTYGLIPQLLIPRIFNANKIASHESTYVLNIYYGKQRREDTLTTTIGWGLIAEAYANYGFWGCGILAVVCGVGYGYVTLSSINAPVFSDRYLFTVLIMSYAFQTEFTAGVYVAALFQSATTLFIFVTLFMKEKSREMIESL